MIHHTFTPESRAVVSPLPESNVSPNLGWHKNFTYVATFLLALLGMTSISASAQDTAITCAARWVNLGRPGFNAGGPTAYPSMAFSSDNVPHVAYRDGGNAGRLTVSKYTGTGSTGWTNVGPAGFGSLGTVNFTNLAISAADSFWVAYKDESTNKAVVRKFDGTSWNQVGASLSVGTADYISLDLDESGIPYVAYRDAFNGKLSVKKLAGDTWVDVGSTYVTASSIHATARITIDVDGGIPYVAYRETNGKLSVIKYSSSTWSSLGGVFTDSTEYPALAVKSGIPYVIYQDVPLSRKATVKKFDGTSWITLGTAGFTQAEAIWNDITVNGAGQPVIIYESDSSTSKTNAMFFDGSSWNYIANPYFSGASSTYNQVSVDGAGNYWASYSDNLYSTRISVLKVTTAVLQPTTGPDFACTGGSATFVNTTPGGSWSSSNASVGTIGSTTGILATSAFAGTTTISYTVYTGCSRTKLVSVNTTPGTISGGAAAFCALGTTTLTVPGGGVWTSSNPEIATVGSSSGVVTGVSGGTATITLTNSGGCTKTKVVTINALPTISDITGNLTVATSRITSQLSATPTGGTWSSGTIAVGTVSTTGLVTGGTTAGTTVISYRVTATGCTNTVTAVVTNKTAVVGLNLDGTNDYISLTEGVSSATDFTFEAWVNPSSNVSDARLFDFGTSATSDMYFTTRDATSTFPKFAITSGGETQSVSATAALPLSTWSHLAVTLGGGVAKMYVNGALVATNSSFTFTPSTIGSTAINSIGRSITSGNYFAGSIDEVRFWNVARSLEDIQASKNCDIDPTTGLLMSYRFNNGTAASSNTSNTTAVDYSGNNKCGTLNSFALTGTTSNYVIGALGLCNSVSSPVFSVNPVAAVCAGQNTTLTTTGTGGTWSSSNTTVGTINAATGIFTGLTGGTTTVSYTVVANCIPTSFSTVVTVNAQPTAFTGTLSACEGSTSALGSTPASGTWTSSAPAVATVGTSGIVSGVLAGTTTISYVHPTTGCVRTAEFTVNPLPSAITGSTNTDIAATTTLTSTPAGSWTSANNAVATVNSTTGEVTGVASGTTTISYTTAAGCTRTTAFTVNLAAISGSSSTCIGVPVTLTHPLSGGTWVSGTTAVATVGSSSGIVTGVSTGTSVITYNAIGLSRTFVITVLGTAPVISGTTTLCAASATTLSATPTSGDWSSSNLTVASVNTTNGIVTGNTSGTAVITYTLGSCFSTTTVTVAAPLAAIGGNSTVCIGGAIALTHSTGSGTWSSSSPSNATVNTATGLVSAVAAGNTTITYAVSPTCYATKAVTVAPAPAAITGVASVCQGATTTLSHTTSGGTWVSGTTSVATVDATGVVTGVAAGTSVISYFTSEGCFVTRTVTVIALPSAIGGTASLCEGATTTLTGAGAGTWLSSNTDVATIGNTSGIVSGLTAGTTNITFTLTSTGCSVSRIVTVNALPSVIGGSLSVCASATTTLTATPAGGSWSSGSTGIATIDEATGVATGVAAGTSVVSYTSAAGCRRTAVVTVNSLPSVISGSSSLCVGSTTTLTSATSSQTWSSSNPSVATVATATATTGLVTGIATGTAVISYTNATGCSRTLTVTVSSAPAAITGDDIVCNGGTVALSTTSTGGTWSSGNAARATVNSITGSVAGVSAGVVVITYSLGSTCYVTKQMTVNTAPAAISGVGTVCIGNTLSLTHAVPSGTWSTLSSNVSVGASTGVVTGIAAGTGVVTYNTSAGCFVTAVVTVNAASAAITGTAVVCEGATTTLSGGGAGTWASQSGAVATVVSATGVVTGVAAGTTNITFTPASTGCSTTRIVTVNAQPATITGTGSVCVGNTTSLASATGGGSWVSSTPSVATIGTNGTVTGVTTGTSLVSYTLSSGCRNTRVVTVNGTPAAITGSLGYCLGSTGTLSSATTGQTWSSSNTSAVTINASTGLLSAAGLGTSTISYTNSFGCAQSVIVTVSTAATPIGGDNEVCIGAATTLTNATSGGTWISGNTSIATILGATGYITGVAAGTVNITYQISAGCFVTRVMTVSTSPAIPITGPATVCVGSSVTLSHATPGGTWVSGNPSRASVVSGTGVVTGLTAGAFTVTYYTNSGCYRTYSMTVNPVPSLIGGSAVVCEGSTTTLTNSTAGGTWINDGAFCTVGNTTGIVTGVSAGLGTVSYVIAATGCAITKTVTVNETPAAIAGAGTICVGATATLTSTPAGGMWVSSLIGKASIGMVNGVLRGVAVGTSMISYTSASGCRTTTIVTVLASPAAITGTSSMCIGSSTTLTNATAGLVWSSADAGVATVSTASATTGLVTGLTTGTTEIRYTSASGCAATMVVTVTASGTPITGPDVVCIGGTISLVGGAGTWVSSNTARATVAAGVVTGISAGPVTITYRSSATCFVTKAITVNTSPADAITGPTAVCQGAEITLAHPVAGGTWSSSMPIRASIDAISGVVRGVSAGAVTMSYQTQPGCFRTYTVTVSPYVFPISGTYVVCEGKTTTLTSAQAGGVWSSGTPAVATINSVTGLLTGVSDGITTITYTTISTGCNTVRDITVNPIPSVVTGAPAMCIGGNATYIATPAGGTWSTSAGIITTINATTGVARGIAAGNAFISYTLPTGCVNRTASAVTVNPLPYPITGNALLAYGASRTLASYTTGAVWSSSNPAVATISPTGVVTAGFGDGNTTISYTFAGTGCGVARQVTVNATGTRFAATSTDNAEIDLKVFPSPTNGILTVESPVNGSLSVFTIDGKSVGTYNINSTSVTINLPESIASGIYMCRFEGEDGSTKIFRILCAK